MLRQSALELPAHQRMQLGVLVDRAIDAHEQPLRLERGEVGLEIERRSGGAPSRRPVRIGADVEHGRDLLVSPLTYDLWRLQCNAFGVSSAAAFALLRGSDHGR